MKNPAILVVIIGIVLFHGAAGESVLEKVNVDAYLRNPKLIEYHIRCLVYDGACDKIGSEIKRLFPLVGRQCKGCTQDQKTKLGKIINHWQRNYPQAWQDLVRRVQNN